ncbi:hypothetical protein B0H14DRAFT_2602907 [Mycena olivaceomarginata]|nr:hypothetical protein B0H14DRAFT_2602907 [Mycena olivaceomarginata]
MPYGAAKHGVPCFEAAGESDSIKLGIIAPHILVDPTDPFGGLKSNASSLRRLNKTYDVFGVFCRPKTAHSTEFRNQSYTDFACNRGLPSFAIDLTASILPGVEPFKKVIGIGHSAGSVALVFGAVAKADQLPFDSLILTGNLIIEPGTLLTIPGVMSTRNDTPLRWGALDPDYTTMNNHSIFYPTSLSRMLIFDAFTKDVGTVATFPGLSVSSLTANYTGPVTKVVGSEDRHWNGPV